MRTPPPHPRLYHPATLARTNNQKQEELQFAVGAAVADLACSGPLRVPPGKLLEDMRASAVSARREMKEEESAGDEGGGGALINALDYVLYQVGGSRVPDGGACDSGIAAGVSPLRLL